MSHKREVEIAVISDIHLGTPNCRADMIWDYLRSIRPQVLIINGDLCDLGDYWRNHWPREHLMVLRRILKIAANDSQVFFLVGNHDAPVRRFHGSSIGNLHIRGRLELDHPDGKRTLIVHGDCFDGAVSCPAWLHRLGGWLYDRILGMGSAINAMRRLLGKPPMSLATTIKNNIGMAQRYIERFRHAAVDAARKGGFDTVITGHIHQPDIHCLDDITYLNSGDWVEHCTALEYNQGQWHLHSHTLSDSGDNGQIDDDHDVKLPAMLGSYGVVAA